LSVLKNGLLCGGRSETEATSERLEAFSESIL
jgi:hypothetical protein